MALSVKLHPTLCTWPMVTLINALAPCAFYPDSIGRLWARVIWQGLPLPLWEFGQLGVFLPLHPHLCRHSWGLPGVLEGPLPCLVWVRAAINGNLLTQLSHSLCRLVVTMALVLTISWVSSFLLSTLWVATISCEYEVPGAPYKYQTELQMCLQTSWKRQSLRCCCTSMSTILLRHQSWIWFRVPSNLIAKEGTFSLLPWVTL